MSGKKRKSAGGSSEGAEEKVVRFVCDGEEEAVSMVVSAFRENCKPIGTAK